MVLLMPKHIEFSKIFIGVSIITITSFISALSKNAGINKMTTAGSFSQIERNANQLFELAMNMLTFFSYLVGAGLVTIALFNMVSGEHFTSSTAKSKNNKRDNVTSDNLGTVQILQLNEIEKQLLINNIHAVISHKKPEDFNSEKVKYLFNTLESLLGYSDTEVTRKDFNEIERMFKL